MRGRGLGEKTRVSPISGVWGRLPGVSVHRRPHVRARWRRKTSRRSRRRLFGSTRQRREVPTQQKPHGGPAAAPPGGRGLPRSDQRGAFLPAPVRAREFLRLHGGPRHRRQRDPSQALPVPRGSAEPVALLTRRPEPLAVRQLRDFNRAPQPRPLT